MVEDEEGKVYQKGACGGFGKGNFSELFKSIEEYEKTLEANLIILFRFWNLRFFLLYFPHGKDEIGKGVGKFVAFF